MTRLLAYLTFVMFIVGWTSDQPLDVRDGDAELFDDEVQPIVTTRCAFLGCHGREGMPLALYAVDYLRLRDPDGEIDSSRPVLQERVLTPVEIDHNRRSLAARVVPGDEDTVQRVLLRLVPVERGGIPHAEVEVYETLDHPEIEVLREFLESVR